MSDWIAFAVSVLGLGALIAVGEMLKRRGSSAESTRRLVHAGTGTFVAVTPYLFDGPALVYVLAALVVVVNGIAVHRRWLAGLHGIERESVGTVTFPLALIPILWACWSLDADRVFAMQTAFLVLAFADPLAATVGDRVRPVVVLRLGRDRKTVAGTLTFGATAFVISVAVLAAFDAVGTLDWPIVVIVGAALIVAVVTSGVEAVSSGGWDNFFVAVAGAVVLVAVDEMPGQRAELMASVVAGGAFAWVASRVRFLSVEGAAVAGLFAASLLGLGGWAWAAPALVFFVLSSMLSTWNASRDAAEALSEKGHVRDAGQVYANGGIAWICLLLYVVAPLLVWYVAFIGALAAAAADTWATEIGTRLRATARMLTSGRIVPAGTSGAVTWPGTLGAVAGALSVAVTAAAVAPTMGIEGGAAGLLASSVAGGVLASFVDGFAGATLQARYRVPQTGFITERASSGGGANELAGGLRWMGNDLVNWAGSAAGAVLTTTCFQLLLFGI